MKPDTDNLRFSQEQLITVNQAVAASEELVSDGYKFSASQMRQLNYDIKTAAELDAHEIVKNHFAQVVRYRAEKKDSLLNTDTDDFYKICLQDHSILSTLAEAPELRLYPFLLYIICHELIHVVRFRHFLQQFNVPEEQRNAEEVRVHRRTHEILARRRISGMRSVFSFYEKWRLHPEMETDLREGE